MHALFPTQTNASQIFTAVFMLSEFMDKKIPHNFETGELERKRNQEKCRRARSYVKIVKIVKK